VLVFIFKNGTRKMIDVKVNGETPQIFMCKQTGILIREKDITLQMISKSMTKVTSNITVVTTVTEYSFEKFMDIVKTLTKDQFETLKGNIVMKPVKERSNFEHTFMRANHQIMKVQELRDKGSKNMCFNAFNPPFSIIGVQDLINLDQQGTRLMEVTRNYEKYQFMDLFRNATSLSNYTILILGSDRTTGYGKTQLALCLACHYSKSRCKALQLPEDEAKVVFSNTIDIGNEVEFKPGMVWVIDEFMPADTESQVYITENMLKVLLSPRQSGSLRARNKDIKLPEGVARIITANAKNMEEWVGKKIPCSDPLKRKSIAFIITKPLCSDGWRSQTCGSVEKDASVEAISHVMMNSMPSSSSQPSSSSDLPANTLMSLFGCPQRG